MNPPSKLYFISQDSDIKESEINLKILVIGLRNQVKKLLQKNDFISQEFREVLAENQKLKKEIKTLKAILDESRG